ncbi:hypothetical protein VTO42DRAFT_6348 [Malbranchea cinnamomea]
MDSDSAQLDISKLSEADKREVAQLLVNEQQKSQIHTMVHHLSNLCWKKCITSKITSGTLDKNEEACAQNCVERYMDTNVAVFQHLQTLRGSH